MGDNMDLTSPASNKDTWSPLKHLRMVPAMFPTTHDSETAQIGISKLSTGVGYFPTDSTPAHRITGCVRECDLLTNMTMVMMCALIPELAGGAAGAAGIIVAVTAWVMVYVTALNHHHAAHQDGKDVATLGKPPKARHTVGKLLLGWTRRGEPWEIRFSTTKAGCDIPGQYFSLFIPSGWAVYIPLELLSTVFFHSIPTPPSDRLGFQVRIKCGGDVSLAAASRGYLAPQTLAEARNYVGTAMSTAAFKIVKEEADHALAQGRRFSSGNAQAGGLAAFAAGVGAGADAHAASAASRAADMPYHTMLSDSMKSSGPGQTSAASAASRAADMPYHTMLSDSMKDSASGQTSAASAASRAADMPYHTMLSDPMKSSGPGQTSAASAASRAAGVPFFTMLSDPMKSSASGQASERFHALPPGVHKCPGCGVDFGNCSNGKKNFFVHIGFVAGNVHLVHDVLQIKCKYPIFMGTKAALKAALMARVQEILDGRYP